MVQQKGRRTASSQGQREGAGTQVGAGVLVQCALSRLPTGAPVRPWRGLALVWGHVEIRVENGPAARARRR
jgi:hypothetical protein